MRSNSNRSSSRVASESSPTIYALSTAPGRAAIAIIRVSGPECLKIYHALCPNKPYPKPRQAVLRTLYDPSDSSQKLDANALVLFFPAPQTATGEDVLELHIHGGNAVVKAILAAIPRASQANIRYAEPGEFTRRAFYNNRLDLTEVEALGDTLAAETEQQRQLAVRGSSNALGQQYEEWRQNLLYARGELEALIDFSEDQQFDDAPEALYASVTEQVKRLKDLVQTSIQNAFRGELLRNGISVALVGAPNAGKSSLLNRIVRREAAIVSREAGTTRDVVEVGVDIGGYFCRFGDLAGLRALSETTIPIGEIEKEGMRRAKERALRADVVIVVLCVEGNSQQIQISSEVEEVLRELDRQRQDVVYVVNKADLLPSAANHDAISHSLLNNLIEHNLPPSSQPPLMVSCIDEQTSMKARKIPSGLPDLMACLTRLFQSKTAVVLPEQAPPPGYSHRQDSWAESLGASERHRLLLQHCLSHLGDFLACTRTQDMEAPSHLEHADIDVVVAAENLRQAADCLARITGKGEGGDVEEILGVVFEKSAMKNR
ncbi:hypothetical protein G7Y79_00007g022040 [Physcia stellaris]|nr:hypothetical protein G7Y79_00007g022040 [Physcia stellaris]